MPNVEKILEESCQGNFISVESNDKDVELLIYVFLRNISFPNN